jgi:alkylhydroperoxidase family enzyme
MPRLPYLDKADIAPEYQDIIARGYNLHRTLLHSPKTARASGNVGRHIRFEAAIDDRLRELAILQVTYLARSEYEYSHHLQIALDFGVAKADLHAIAEESAGRPSALEPLAKAVLRAAREMTEDKVSDATFAELKAGLTPEEIVDLIFAIGFYCGFVRITGSLQIDVEPQYGPLLAEFPLAPL